ncbi:hypothetical protein L208DRAFT_1526514 [Tricholoma matsutake]|nr:hypothetical protein L208DRAFT_1526514 [Tricholoma matsutake 945]
MIVTQCSLEHVKSPLGPQAPRSAKQVHQFLGLVCYISVFLLVLAEHTSVLTLLMKKECNGSFPVWTVEHQFAFDTIKGLVLSWDCLILIDHNDPRENKIFVTCDASKQCTGAVLSFGESWESADRSSSRLKDRFNTLASF